jgi:hypothetical protein
MAAPNAQVLNGAGDLHRAAPHNGAVLHDQVVFLSDAAATDRLPDFHPGFRRNEQELFQGDSSGGSERFFCPFGRFDPT